MLSLGLFEIDFEVSFSVLSSDLVPSLILQLCSLEFPSLFGLPHPPRLSTFSSCDFSLDLEDGAYFPASAFFCFSIYINLEIRWRASSCVTG